MSIYGPSSLDISCGQLWTWLFSPKRDTYTRVQTPRARDDSGERKVERNRSVEEESEANPKASTAPCETARFSLLPNDIWFFTTLEAKETHHHWSHGRGCCQGILCSYRVIGDGFDMGFWNVLCLWWNRWSVSEIIGFGRGFCVLMNDFFFQSWFYGFDWTWNWATCYFYVNIAKIVLLERVSDWLVSVLSD